MSRKPAAHVTDPKTCPLSGHGTNAIASSFGDEFFDDLPADCQGDITECGGAMSVRLATIVLINGKLAETLDSVGTHGNKVTAGSGTIIIGNLLMPASFVAPLPVDIKWPFTESFVVIDPETAEPVADRAGKTSLIGFSASEGGHVMIRAPKSHRHLLRLM